MGHRYSANSPWGQSRDSDHKWSGRAPACGIRRSGFTLIELIIVVVIIGLLAALAVPRFSQAKGKAHFAAMRSDLHHLATAEEGYFFEHHGYTSRVDSLEVSLSSGVVMTVSEATTEGFGATSTHPASFPHMCALFVGNAAPVPPATLPGVVACQ